MNFKPNQPGPCSVVFRIAGGPTVGFGHVRRSWTLAAYLGAEGWAVRIVGTSPEATATLQSAGFTSDTESARQSLDTTLRALGGEPQPAVCVVDEPETPTEGLVTLRRLAPVVCLDDLAERVFPVDVVVNGAAGAAELRYRGAPETRYLLGPSFVLLRSSFAPAPDRRAPAPVVRRVLLLTGGGNVGSLVQELVALICDVLPLVHVDVVVGPFSRPPVFNGTLGPRVTVHHVPDDMRGLMLRADLAISGGGQTLYELAATATPTIAIGLARDQVVNLRGLSAAGAVQDAGAPDDPAFSQKLSEALARLAEDPAARAAMGAAGRRLVDGRGTERVAEALRALVPSSSGQAR